MMAAANRPQELRVHLKGALTNGCSPEEIRDIFQTSKKAFKQALGALFRERRIRFEKPGIRLNPHNPPKRR